jgi:hypothetical protein
MYHLEIIIIIIIIINFNSSYTSHKCNIRRPVHCSLGINEIRILLMFDSHFLNLKCLDHLVIRYL